MDYAQETITTLHDLGGTTPAVDTDAACVVIPMTDREYGALPTERVLSTLERVGPGRVVVALRASADDVESYRRWLSGFDLPLDVLWCTGDRLGDLLAARGLDGEAGKGRDVWLALGMATAEHPYVVVHDADTRSYSPEYVRRLLAPLEADFSFTKGYYARVENNRLYGRLYRLFYAPLIRALRRRSDAPVLSYLASFRYALAGEFAATARLAGRLRVERRYGLEVGTLGDAYAFAGVDGTAQVDLGRYEHDHRAVSGPAGLADMSRDVGRAVFRILEDRDVSPDYERLRSAYRDTASRFIEQYAADATFNGLDYDADEERSQVETYVDAIEPPREDTRLPPWEAVDLTPQEVSTAAEQDLLEVA